MENIRIAEKENSEVEITGEIPAEKFERFRSAAVQNLSRHVHIDGFRKGHIPENILVRKIGEQAILEEMADLALKNTYPKIIAEKNIRAIGRPLVGITKLAKGNPLGFKITTAVMPTVTLTDYKKIAREALKAKENVTVEEAEVEETLRELRKLRARAQRDSGDSNAPASDTQEELPPVDDDFAKSLGGGLKNVEDLKNKLRENIRLEKERKLRDKKRLEIIEAIIAEADIPLPRIIIEGELDRMVERMKNDIARAGGTFEEYLKHIKKTEEDLRKEWTPDAEKRGKVQLILNKIAEEEGIAPEKDKVEKEVKHLLAHYKDAREEDVRVFAESIITNEAVFAFLEGLK